MSLPSVCHSEQTAASPCNMSAAGDSNSGLASPTTASVLSPGMSVE